nr:reverse transcriptase domain-containing protein [Tanacetum cinerariifolium]
MRNRSKSSPNNSNATIPRRQNRKRIPNIVEPEIRTIEEVVPMADRTMKELLQAPTEGYGEAIVISEILAENFEIKTNLLQLVQINKFHDFERDNSHTHISNFKRMTSTLKYRDVPNDAIKLMLYPYSLEGAARICNQSSVCAATGTYNQVSPPNRASNQMAPPGFAPVQNNQNRGDSNKQEENLRRNLNNDMRSILGSFFQNQASTSGIFPCNTIPNPKGEMKAVTTRSGLDYKGPSILTNSSPGKLFGRSSFVPKFASTIKSLLTNKDKLFELTKVALNENCSAMFLKKLPEKLGDPEKFLIPCYFSGMDLCHSLADLGASINLMPLSIWKKLSLPKLTSTRMSLELADRSITCPKGVTEDVFIKVGKFHFPTEFVVVDFEADPRVPLILGRSFLRTGRALIDVYGEEITLQVNDESVIFNLNQTIRYSSTYDDNLVNRIDVIDISCEVYAQDVLDFKYNSKSGNLIHDFFPI